MKCFVFVVLLAGNLFVQGSDDAQKDKAKKSEAFYQKINETIRTELKLYTKRVDCIVNELKLSEAIRLVNDSHYHIVAVDGDYSIEFINKDIFLLELKPSIESANFSCTIVGYCAIVLIITVMVIVVTCVSCLSKKK